MATAGKTVHIVMDGREISVDQGMSILDAARQNDIPIPTLCHHPHLSAYGGCRLCVVEVDGSPRLAAGCVTPVRDGMQIVTANERILHYRRTILEFLFAERNHNCMICPASGDCELQALAYQLQMDHLTVPASFEPFTMDVTSPCLSFDHNRCILCGRCVRACWEISGTRVLNFIHRGPETRIGFDFDGPRGGSTCHACGICLQVCPTGAIVNRYRTHYAVRGHDKSRWKQIESVCPLCGFSCRVTATVSGDTLIRVEGILEKDPGRPDGGQLCRRGRFEVLKTKGRRLVAPMVKTLGGEFEHTDLDTALNRVVETLNRVRDTHGGTTVLGMVSPMLSNETLQCFKDLMVRAWQAGAVDTLDGDHFRTLVQTGYLAHGRLPEASWKKIPGADLILVTGASPDQTHPLAAALIHRAILENQAKLAVIGDGGSFSAMALFSIPVSREKAPALIRLMRQKIRGPADEKPDKYPGLYEAQIPLFQEMVNAFVHARSPVVITGEGFTGPGSAGVLTDLMALAMPGQGGAGSGFILLKPFGNSAGAWKLEIPSPARPCPERPYRAALVMLSGEEDDAALLTGPAGTSGFLAVITPFFPENLAERADLLIPAPFWMEEDGTYTALDGRKTFLKKRLMDPPQPVGTTREILSALAQKAGFTRAPGPGPGIRQKEGI